MEIHWSWSDGVMNAVGIEAELRTERERESSKFSSSVLDSCHGSISAS